MLNILPAGAPALIYARLSYNPDGTKESVDRQVRLATAALERAGYAAPGPEGIFTDDNLSAWDTGVHRPGWEALLRHLDRGPERLLAFYVADRLTRNGRDSERLLALGKARSLVLIDARGALTDLSHRGGRLQTRIMSAVGEDYSDAVQEKVRDAMRERRARGKVDKLGYGWRRVPGTTADVELDPGEVAVIREVAEGLLAGQSWQACLGPLAARGVRTKTGHVIDPAMMRKVLCAPRTAGRIESNGELLGRYPGEAPLDEITWRAIGAWFASRKRGRPASDAHLLSGLVQCGRCGASMNGAAGQSRNRAGRVTGSYNRLVCFGPLGPGVSTCGNSITAGPLEAQCKAAVQLWQADKARRAGIEAHGGVLAAERSKAEEEVGRLQTVTSDLFARYIAGTLSKDQFDRHSAGLEAKLVEVRSRLVELSAEGATTSALQGVLDEEWETQTIAMRRQAVRDAVATPIVVHPVRLRTRGVDLTRFEVRPAAPLA